MEEKDIEKTAFPVLGSHFEYAKMPFGLSSLPQTFQRLMNNTLKDFIPDLLLVYLDDILIYAKDFDEHLERLEKVFKRMRELGLKLNPKKCSFFLKEVEYLGHSISGNGIGTIESKIEAIVKINRPTTQTKVRSFLGMTSQYRLFIKKIMLYMQNLFKIW